MYEYRITLNTYEDTAREILKGIQLKLFLIKQRSFLKIITAKLKGKADRVEKEKTKTIFIEESDDKKYLERIRKVLEDWLDSDYTKLKEDGSGEYNSLLNDRFIQKVNRKAHKLTANIKDKALRTALGGSDIRGFFLRIGLGITTEVKKA